MQLLVIIIIIFDCDLMVLTLKPYIDKFWISIFFSAYRIQDKQYIMLGNFI